MKEGLLYFQRVPNWIPFFGKFVRMIESVQGFQINHCGVVFEQKVPLKRWLGKWWAIESFPVVGVWEIPLWLIKARFFWQKIQFRFLPEFVEDPRRLYIECAVHEGKKYDYGFRWSKDRIYCSEMVYDAYASATGNPLCHVENLKDLNYQPHVTEIKELQAGKELDLTQLVVTVKDIYENSYPFI